MLSGNHETVSYAKQLAKRYGSQVRLVSSKTGHGVQDLFTDAVHQYLVRDREPVSLNWTPHHHRSPQLTSHRFRGFNCRYLNTCTEYLLCNSAQVCVLLAVTRGQYKSERIPTLFDNLISEIIDAVHRFTESDFASIIA